MKDERKKINLSPELEARLEFIAKMTNGNLQSAISHSLFLGTNIFLGWAHAGAMDGPNQGRQKKSNRAHTGALDGPNQGQALAGASNEPINIGSYTGNKKNIVFSSNTQKKPTKKKNKDLGDDEKFSLQVIFDLWNSTVKSLARVHGKNRSRLAAVKARQAEGFDLAQVFAKVEASDFLTQRTPNERNWSANFDWVIRPHQCPRISEGQFDNTTKNEHFDDSRFDPDRI